MIMSKIKIALCQMNVIDDKEQNIKKAKSMIRKATCEKVDIIILPEMFNCPYSNDKFIEYCESEDNSLTLNEISSLTSMSKRCILRCFAMILPFLSNR